MKTIITAAITGAVTTREESPYLPITPEEIATSALEAAEAGAAIVHLHVRNTETGKPSMDIDLYKDTVDRIKKHNTTVLINLTTGPGAVYVPTPGNLSQGAPGTVLLHAEARVKHIQLIKPDICSMDFNTMHQANGAIRINHKRITSEMVRLVQEAGTLPELEIFDSGDMRIALEFLDEGIIKGQPFWQFAMGVKYGWPATPTALTHAYAMLPRDSVWSAFGIGKTEMELVAQSKILGGHVRVGLEDNVYVSKGVLAKTNAELVVMAVDLIRLLGGQHASPSEARDILKL